MLERFKAEAFQDRVYAITPKGTIVELPLIKVKMRRGPILGEVEEAFIQGLVAGDTFVFGGGLVHYGDALFAPLRAEFDHYNHIPLPVYFKMAELKADFGIIGAAAFLKEN